MRNLTLLFSLVLLGFAMFSCELNNADDLSPLEEPAIQLSEEVEAYVCTQETPLEEVEAGMASLNSALVAEENLVRMTFNEAEATFTFELEDGAGAGQPYQNPARYLGSFNCNELEAIVAFSMLFGSGCQRDICWSQNSSGNYDVWNGC